jgi:DNA-binding beta-propeller fold protein YncE
MMKHHVRSSPRSSFSARLTVALLTGCLLFAGKAIAARPPKPLPQIELTVLGSYASGIFNAGGSEIAAHDRLTQRLYVVNAQDASVNVLSIVDPANPTLVGNVSLIPFGGVANSVAVHEGLVAVAMEATPNRTDPGQVVFFDSSLTFISAVTVGAIPDMLTFTHKGRFVLVANEGEPKSYNQPDSVDPEGSVSIIDLLNGPAALTQANVATADFHAFNGLEGTLRTNGIRIFGFNASASQDLEPEYIAVSPDDTTAWVTLQENNAMATVDIASATVTSIVSLGLKDHSLPGNALDPNNSGAISIANWPVKGLYQPDGIAAYPVGAEVLLFMANEGDVRTDWPGLNEEITVGSTNPTNNYVLDPTVFPNAAFLKSNSALGRLRVSKFSGDLDGDGDYDEIHSHGGRSFSIRRADGSLVFDSGDDFEQITASLHTNGVVIFNASHDNNIPDNRSRAKGPEPEGIAVGRAFQRTWAFIGLERVGGVMVYDVTDPVNSRFVTYANNRNFADTPINFATAGDLGPEGILFIDEGDSPTGEPLVVTANEISGTTTIYRVNKL